MLELNAPIEHTITITYFDARKITEDGNVAPAIVTAVITKPDKSSAWKLIKDCEAKASSQPFIALIQTCIEVAGIEAYCHDYR